MLNKHPPKLLVCRLSAVVWRGRAVLTPLTPFTSHTPHVAFKNAGGEGGVAKVSRGLSSC